MSINTIDMAEITYHTVAQRVISYIARQNKRTYTEIDQLFPTLDIEEFERFYKEYESYNKENGTDENKTNIKNKGSGAGGETTNKNGKKWENDTCNKDRLLSQGFIYDSGVLLKKFQHTHEILYFAQGDLKRYFQREHNITIYRNPDEAYLIKKRDGSSVIKILEKKFQNVEGSVEDKLLTGAQIKREYELLLQNLDIKVSYAYCLSPFLEKKIKSDKLKYKIWNQIFQENDITILFGENQDYYIKLDTWISSF